MLSLIPLLKTQQELLDVPRCRKRFERYLEAMTGGTDDIVLLLPRFNPMAKEHVAEVVDSLIGMEAETHTAAALRLGGVKASAVPRLIGSLRNGQSVNLPEASGALALGNRRRGIPRFEFAPVFLTALDHALLHKIPQE